MILSRSEQPWPCPREEPEQPHHQVHVVVADVIGDGEAAAIGVNYAERLAQPVYVRYWSNSTSWMQTLAVFTPEE